MKKSIEKLNLIAALFVVVLLSSCTNDIGGDSLLPVIPDSQIKSITFDGGYGVESWEFVYDESGRVISIANSWEGGDPELITYDYSQSGELVINKAGNITNYSLDEEGRISKEFWNESGTAYARFVYDSEGFLSEVIEHYDGADHLKYKNVIEDGNITNRVRYEDDGVTLREDRVFDFTIASNPSSIHQTFTVDSQWKTLGGLFGVQSKKLVSNYTRILASDPDSNYGATFDYTFDEENRVATQVKNGTSSGGGFTESWSYTYYEN
ncbi:hypothetical protein [Winogradskyella sp. SM1960]|uniref:hypothetical protein n=1 Tax=Winogradskyella sp. SM1960 TaxID=2865955 RepID=UPI001CD23F06|nr:hypothetical protein [Winogradskyella sp. SM1960]